MPESVIRIEGLAEFSRSLRQLDSEAPKQLRLVHNEAANLLIKRTTPKVPRISGNAVASMKAKSTRTSARVSVGGRRAPYFPWLDFGGRTGIRGSVVRPFYREGRYVYVTLAEITPEIQQLLLDGLTEVARGAGLDVD
ncbi:hypothetical protein [Actinoplanes awajinensis]|uniref:HK97 gp10 family phage protein n=1 Tax=Actinoplanes awajinensis subsp. mycoplanecinus TaxID=135947 RepID=A0A101J905_9ACTN|nr:hypothetical protein [Actinoplanes awajinensis]KUL22356.1 hypothetical protein ADL15_48350 [Actinoplanes awajinensis subsp. mycoplanecinus]